MMWVIAGAVIALILYAMFRKDDRICPDCASDTIEQGFEGWKRRCPKCGWSNHG